MAEGHTVLSLGVPKTSRGPVPPQYPTRLAESTGQDRGTEKARSPKWTCLVAIKEAPPGEATVRRTMHTKRALHVRRIAETVRLARSGHAFLL